MGFFIFSIGFILISFWLTRQYFIFKCHTKFKHTPQVLLQIKANKLNEKSAIVIESLFATLHATMQSRSFWRWFTKKPLPHFSFEIANIKQHIYFYIWTLAPYQNLITNQLYAQYPDIEIDVVKDYTHTPFADNKFSGFGAEIQTISPFIFPIKRHTQFIDSSSKTFLDPLAAITAAIAQLPNSEEIWIQMVIRPKNNKWQKEGEKIAKKLNKNPNKQIDLNSEVESSHGKETLNQAIVGKLAQLGFDANIRLVYLSKSVSIDQAKLKLQEIIASFYQFNIPRFNGFKVKIAAENNRILVRRFIKRQIVDPYILSLEEIATLWHLPNNTVLTPSIQWVGSRKIEAPLNLPLPETIPPEEFTAMGRSNFRGVSKLFGIKTVDRRRHIYIIGKTGMGKSTILENMIHSDIQNGKGIAVIDPHGDLAESVLSYIPKRRTNDVIIFDPSDTEFPVSFNMLECHNPDQRHLVASGLLGVFKKMFGDSWGPRLEHILRNTILALTFNPGSTMLSIMKMLVDDKYREHILKKVSDPVVLDFWQNEFGKWQPKQIAENVSPIQNKVGQFLSTGIIRNILGQPQSSIDLRFAMDRGKIVIINLSKGKIGEDNSALLGSMMVTKFQLDAMSRADTAEKDRKDFYLYVDEFQNFATESFATILSEARKYKLNLTMANQYIAQMPEEVKGAVFGNVGSIICCQVGAEDADFLSNQFSEEVSAKDIISLPKYHSFIKLMIDGMPSPTFSVHNLPPPQAENDPIQKEKILKVCHEKYAKTRSFVEKKIDEWTKNPK
ncbi:MAG TPA: type IV secretion system DNA-binding domain-containing protein [Candidatus Gracilibacteria bacterium]|nr:type IV secretion system DNA-binding domain-containing protein [Candidatus Gracilibacteria bacterium]